MSGETGEERILIQRSEKELLGYVSWLRFLVNVSISPRIFCRSWSEAKINGPGPFRLYWGARHVNPFSDQR